MLTKSIYGFDSYKEYLLFFEKNFAVYEKAFRSRLAKEIGCQPAFVSQLLRGTAHLNLDQAIRASIFLKLKKEETRYFLLLVEYDRAATNQLKQFIKEQITEIQELNLDPGKTEEDGVKLDLETQTTYYSHWHYAAIHVLTTIPLFQTEKAISAALSIQKAELDTILTFLLSNGLIKQKNGQLTYLKSPKFLPKGSPNFARCQTTWRLAAIDHLARSNKNDLHYSIVSSLSKKDAQEFRKMFYNTIEKYLELVRPSKEETLCAFNLDFFELI